MKNLLLISLFFILISKITLSQSDLENFKGGWKGNLKDNNAFHFTLKIEKISDAGFLLSITNPDQTLLKKTLKIKKGSFEVSVDKHISIEGRWNKEKRQFNVFAQSGLLLYHIPLQKLNDHKFQGTWNIWMVERLIPPTVYLDVEKDNSGKIEIYPFFRDQRFTGTWATNFAQKDSSFSFFDFKTGISFYTNFTDGKAELKIMFAGKTVTKITLKRFSGSIPENYSYKPVSSFYNLPEKMNDGWNVADISESGIDLKLLRQMADSIEAGKITKTHSVLIAKNGKLVYEKYFYGYSPIILHDLRSASKAITSAITGIAIRKGLIISTQQRLYDFLPEKYGYTLKEDKRKSRITVFSLLTMSSGIDAIDFGIKRKSLASEDNYQQSKDWLKTVLEAPMINEPAKHAYYGSANPFLLGKVLQLVIKEPAEYFINENLLQPLGISNYIIQEDDSGHPYFAGGMYLTPRDMLKLGQMYLNKGTWKGKRILSEEWVEESFKKYFVLENTEDKSGFGYLLWHHTYNINGKKINSIEARGAGGQVIFMFPDLGIVTAITSGNYHNGRYWQPQAIMEDYILPAFLK